MAEAKRRSSFIQFLLIFGVVYLGSQLVIRQFFPDRFGGEVRPAGVYVTMTDKSITEGHQPVAVVENRTASGISIASRCPAAPLDIYRVENAGTSAETLTEILPTETAIPCPTEAIDVPSTEKKNIDFAPWKYSAFGTLGVYELRLPSQSAASGSVLHQSGSVLTTRVTIGEPGAITKIFRTFVTAPFLNFLIFIAAILPGHNLGLAIIILTLIVKLLLFIPTKHALEGQKKMQMLQPKLEALKQKYPGDAKKVQEETMKLWAEHKINPFQSCLPMVIQFPILIGLFYVIRDGSHLEASRHLIYAFYQNLDWNFGTNFLGLDLLKPNIFIMPPLLIVLQFIQMKLSFAIQKRKQANKEKEKIIDIGEKKDEKQPVSPQDIQQKIMLYGLPFMIGFFALQFPSAVSLYWGISTLFAIGQQVLVNREHLRV